MRRLATHALTAPGAIVLVALVVRAAVAVARRDDAPVYDALDYDRHAASIAAGDGYPETALAAPGTPSAAHPPAYPYVLGAVYRLTGDSQTAGRLLGAVLGAAAVLLVYVIAREVFGRTAGLAAAALAAVFPPLVAAGTVLLSEALFVPLALGLVAALLAALRRPPSLVWAGAIGALGGLAVLTRTNGLALVVLATVALVAGRPRGERRRALPAAGVLVLAAALTLLPWTLRNSSEFDRTVALTTVHGYNLSLAYNPESERSPRARYRFPPTQPALRGLFGRAGIDEAELDERLRDRALDFMGDHPGYVAEVTWWNSLRMLSLPPGEPDLSFEELGAGDGGRALLKGCGYVLAALALAGAAAAALRRMPARRAWLVAAAAGALWLAVVPALGSARYRAPVDPFLLVFAGAAVTGLRARGRA